MALVDAAGGVPQAEDGSDAAAVLLTDSTTGRVSNPVKGETGRGNSLSADAPLLTPARLIARLHRRLMRGQQV